MSRLIKCVEESLLESNRSHGHKLRHHSDFNYISGSIDMNDTKEGYLFWNILNISYRTSKKYDYITIVKLYHLYGKEVFKTIIPIGYIYIGNYTSKLSHKGFDLICKILESYGNIRRYKK